MDTEATAGVMRKSFQPSFQTTLPTRLHVRRRAAEDAMIKMQRQLEEQGGVWEDPKDADEDARPPHGATTHASNPHTNTTGKRRRDMLCSDEAAKNGFGKAEGVAYSLNGGVEGAELVVVALSALEADTATLDNEGFKVLRSAFKPSHARTEEWHRIVRRKGRFIFNAGDTRRTQAHFCPPEDLEAVAAQAAPHLQTSTWVVLRSARGCVPQPAHCDWDPHAVSDAATAVPCGLLLATAPDTPLDVWPGSWKHVRVTREVQTEDCRQVVLGAGDAVLFRADLVHAGAEWPQTRRRANLRIHAFLDAPDVVRQENHTYRVTSK